MAMYTPAVGDNRTQVQYKCEKPEDLNYNMILQRNPKIPTNYNMILHKKTQWGEIEIDGNVHVGKWR